MKPQILLVAALMAGLSMQAQEDIQFQSDYQLTLTNAGGQFVNNGFSISLYSTPVDEDGMIDGAGDVVNLEFYTEAPGENFSFAGIYNYYDTQAWMDGTASAKFGPGDLMGGIYYEIMTGWVIPMGTTASVYGEYGEVVAEALACEGSTLVITDKGDGVYNLAVDIVTPYGTHATGSWEGPIANYVKNFPEPSGVASVAVSPDGNTTYYNMQGARISNPESGRIYIKVADGETSKVKF